MILWSKRSTGTLDERLTYYDTVHVSAIRHHVDKRAIDSEGSHEKVISVDMLGQWVKFVSIERNSLQNYPNFETGLKIRNRSNERYLSDYRQL